MDISKTIRLVTSVVGIAALIAFIPKVGLADEYSAIDAIVNLQAQLEKQKTQLTSQIKENDQLRKQLSQSSGDAHCSCNRCCESGCQGCCDPGGFCLAGFVTADGWKTKCDDDLSQSNNFGNRFGMLGALNLGSTFNGADAFLGASVGMYDYHGRANAANNADNKIELQTFAMMGLSKRANYCMGDRFSWGASWDYMSDNRFGEMEGQLNHVDLHQVRLLLGRALNQNDEVGLWGAIPLNDDSFRAPNLRRYINVNAMPQVNAYWKRTWFQDAETELRVGWAEEPADVVLGLRSLIPLSDRTALFSNFAYFIPSTSAGDFSNNRVPQSFTEEYWNLTVGITVFTCGRRLPLIPMPDNGTFAVRAPVGDH